MKDTNLIGTRILVGVDGSTTAAHALGTAIDMTRSLGGQLVIVSAYEPIPSSELQRQRLHVPGDIAHRLQPDAEAVEILASAQLRATAGHVASETVAREGPPAEVILDVADERQVGLIVVGNRGMRRRLLRTSVPNEVSHRARCSVLIADTAWAAAAA